MTFSLGVTPNYLLPKTFGKAEISVFKVKTCKVSEKIIKSKTC